MRGSEAVTVVRSLIEAGLRVWVAGGWAADALVGHQTRDHGDLDLAVDSRDLADLVRLLADEGFVVTVDWAPSRLEFTAPDGRTVDVHPVAFTDDGVGLQTGHDGPGFRYAVDGFSTGIIEGLPVPCLSAGQQLRFRRGYPLRPVDDHDIALLTGLGPAR